MRKKKIIMPEELLLEFLFTVSYMISSDRNLILLLLKLKDAQNKSDFLNFNDEDARGLLSGLKLWNVRLLVTSDGPRTAGNIWNVDWTSHQCTPFSLISVTIIDWNNTYSKGHRSKLNWRSRLHPCSPWF